MIIRRATPGELDTVIRLRRRATEWLRTQGTTQWDTDWPDTDTMVAGFARDLAAGTTWFAEAGGLILGCATINTVTADDLWSLREQRSALFVHRLTIDRQAAGRGVGAALLNFAGERAARSGYAWIRLDAWTTNERLHHYYRRQGFRHARTVPYHDTPSAACFERPARPGMALAPIVTEPHWAYVVVFNGRLVGEVTTRSAGPLHDWWTQVPGQTAAGPYVTARMAAKALVLRGVDINVQPPSRNVAS